MRKWLAASLVAGVFLFAASASADKLTAANTRQRFERRRPPPPKPDPIPPYGWYGWQILLGDATAVGLVVTGTPLALLTLPIYFGVPGWAHISHDRPDRAAISWSMRLLAPALVGSLVYPSFKRESGYYGDRGEYHEEDSIGISFAVGLVVGGGRRSLLTRFSLKAIFRTTHLVRLRLKLCRGYPA